MVRSRLTAFVLLAALTIVAPFDLAAAEPELLSQRTFDVAVDSSGTVEVNFVLALSEISSYTVIVTAVRDATEEQLWSGSLQEGFYRLRAPLTKITGSGPLKIVLKTTMINRSNRGNDSFIVYRKWEGSINR